MKKINFKLHSIGFGAMLLFMASCTNDVDQNYPAVSDKPEATLTFDNTALLELDDVATTTVDETVATFTLTADRAFTTDMKFKVEFLPMESTGSLDDVEFSLETTPLDFGIEGFLLTIPANQLSAQFTITSIFDILPEGVETFKFKVYPVGDLNGAIAAASETFTMTIGNSTDDALKITLDWNGDGEYLGEDNEMHDLKDYDFDLEVYDEAFDIVADSYSSSPEEIDFMASNPDGTYYIVPSFWSAAGAATPMLPINFDVKLTVSKPGIFVHDFDLSSVWNSTIGGYTEDNPDAYNVAAYFIKTTDLVTGDAMYELYDMDDVLLASGKMTSLKSALLAKSRTKSRK